MCILSIDSTEVQQAHPCRQAGRQAGLSWWSVAVQHYVTCFAQPLHQIFSSATQRCKQTHNQLHHTTLCT